jgi:hypothetical protein
MSVDQDESSTIDLDPDEMMGAYDVLAPGDAHDALFGGAQLAPESVMLDDDDVSADDDDAEVRAMTTGADRRGDDHDISARAEAAAPCDRETGPCEWNAVCRAHVDDWERAHGGGAGSYLAWLRANAQPIPGWLEGGAVGQRGSGSVDAVAGVAVTEEPPEGVMDATTTTATTTTATTTTPPSRWFQNVDDAFEAEDAAATIREYAAREAIRHERDVPMAKLAARKTVTDAFLKAATPLVFGGPGARSGGGGGGPVDVGSPGSDLGKYDDVLDAYYTGGGGGGGDDDDDAMQTGRGEKRRAEEEA